MAEWDRKATLADLLGQEESRQAAVASGLGQEPPDPQEEQFLKKMQELARGLRDSEYWDLVSLVLIQGLEDAKGALESETTSDRDMRLHQGEAKAYREAFNLFVGLAAKSPEVKDG